MQLPELLLPVFFQFAPNVSRAQVKWHAREFAAHNGGKSIIARSMFDGLAIGIDCKTDGKATASGDLHQASDSIILDGVAGARKIHLHAKVYQTINEATNGAPASWVEGAKHYLCRNEE